MNKETQLDHLRERLLSHARLLVPLSPSHLMQQRDAFRKLPVDLCTALLVHRAEALSWLSDKAEKENLPRSLVFMEELMSEALLTSHPYLLLDQEHWQSWRTLHDTLQQAVTAVVGAAKHPDDLKQRLAEVLSRYADGLLGFLNEVGSQQEAGEDFLEQLPPCALYRPETQLSVLSLDTESLKEPILDLGCGREAKLFTYLNERNRRVVGVDRFVEPSSNRLRVDWFELPLGAPIWGTIIAHQSVSLHFLHHHLRQNPVAMEYARLMMRLLASLKVGGRLIYAPSLPFFEPLLDDREFQVRHYPITLPGNIRPPQLPDLAEAPLNATHIERLGQLH